ncbi:methyl-accepting chemotaxis protein, partial [Sporosarcina sp. GW1-11]|nr:methyl-accepting chemotaxis protein [Sporosarcina sp. GW1-11]
MKFKDSLTFQLGTIIAGILLVMLAITSIATYKTAYDKLYDAAGIEAYGCANITTGLIRPEEIRKALSGDVEMQDEIGKTLNWTTDHKNIFETQYILDLDGNLIALDD